MGKVVILGAGAAGLMAAIFAAEAGADVTLLESTRNGGKKILISGGGRCNVLPSALSPKQYVTASSPHSLKKILLSWPLKEQRRYFEEVLGIPLALEDETGKLFPVSNRARDVRDTLIRAASSHGTRIRFGTPAREIIAPDVDERWRILSDEEEFEADTVILSTGGLSVPQTGSDGFGLRVAAELGHTINRTYPALTPLTANPPVHSDLAGISLSVTLRAPTATGVFTTTGGFLFTHRGYSGPAVLNVSHLATQAAEVGEAQQILVQWGPDDTGEWESRLKERGSGRVLPLLRRHLPERLAEKLLVELSIAPDRSLAQLRREERSSLIEWLTRYPLPWTGDEGYRKAEVTGGGVALGEVDPRTLESRIRPRLYFCGEVLDAFGPIGGYNFAWAWATGRAAGIGAALRVSEV